MPVKKETCFLSAASVKRVLLGMRTLLGVCLIGCWKVIILPYEAVQLYLFQVESLVVWHRSSNRICQ